MTHSTLVTGANGFVGRSLLAEMARRQLRSVGAVRVLPDEDQGGAGRTVAAPDLLTQGLPDAAWEGIRTVVHTAARVHVMQDTAADPSSEFRRVNVEGTARLASQAATAGVRRFVFISSIKVNGEGTAPGVRYRADDPPHPADPYGISKLEAEQALQRIAAESGMEVVIIRPVLVYGPGVKGNFKTMLQWIERGIPLPLGAVDNRRSLVAVANLVDLIVTCTAHPAAANETFLVSDGEDLSTPELLRRTARAMGRRARLLPVPPAFLQRIAGGVGKGDVARRLLESLQVDVAKTRTMLGWTPVVSVDEALRETVAAQRSR